MSRTVMVDPRFPEELQRLRQRRELSLRACAQLVNYSHTYLWEIEAGRKQPTAEMAERLDTALGAGGRLAGMVATPSPPLNPDDEQRLADVARHPRRLDPATIDALTVTLAHQRRLEDTLGASLLVAPVHEQLSLVETLTADVPIRLHRSMFGLAAQWAQFAGWLNAASDQSDRAAAWYARAMEWASEVGDADMMATTLSMRGHLAYTAEQFPSMLRLTQSALWLPAGIAVRAIATQQEARAYALLGDADACDDRLDRAEELIHRAAEQPEQNPPWLYFLDPHYFSLQRGLALVILQRYDRAIDALTTGLARLPADVRRSAWTGRYLCQLASAHADVGNRDSAIGAVEEALDIAATTGTAQLRAEAERIGRQLTL